MTNSLFQLGDFQLHSGASSNWRIDCDALTDGDIVALAKMVVDIVPAPFAAVYGIPRGGTRLARALLPYVTAGATPVLIIDDVLTTGASMEAERRRFNDQGIGVFGAVIFARGSCPVWIKPVFAMQKPSGKIDHEQKARSNGEPQT